MSSYRWDSEDYEKHSGAQQQWARELIAKLSLTGSETVLDIGCGDGKVTAEIAQSLNRGSVIGIDSSPSMIELARKRYPDGEHANLSFTLLDAVHARSETAFASCFDLVFSNAALHWVKDHRPVVDGIASCLVPGGKILLQMGGRSNAHAVVEVIEELQVLPRFAPYFIDFDFPYGFLGIEEYETLLNEAGFIDQRIELIERDMIHDGKAGLCGWIRTTWLPYTERIPEQQRDEFIDMIASRYLQRKPLDADGKAHVDMVRLEVEARKPHN